MKDKKTFYGDTNIVIEFATLVHNVPRKSAIKNVQRKYNYPTAQEAEAFVDLYEAVMSGEITMKVSPVSYQEMTNGVITDQPEYINKEVGVFLADAGIDITNNKNATDNKLDKKLVKDFYLTDKYSKGNPAFTYDNIRDAYIMCDAALDGKILVTLNYYDFTRDGKDLVIKTNNRQFYNSLSPDIRGYVSRDMKEVKPMTPMEYLAYAMDKPYNRKEDSGYTLRYKTKKDKEKIERRKLKKEKAAEVKSLLDKMVQEREKTTVSFESKTTHVSRNYIKGVEDSWKEEYGETPWWEIYEYDEDAEQTVSVVSEDVQEDVLDEKEDADVEVETISSEAVQNIQETGVPVVEEDSASIKIVQTQTPEEQ